MLINVKIKYYLFSPSFLCFEIYIYYIGLGIVCRGHMNSPVVFYCSINLTFVDFFKIFSSYKFTYPLHIGVPVLIFGKISFYEGAYRPFDCRVDRKGYYRIRNRLYKVEGDQHRYYKLYYGLNRRRKKNRSKYNVQRYHRCRHNKTSQSKTDYKRRKIFFAAIDQ